MKTSKYANYTYFGKANKKSVFLKSLSNVTSEGGDLIFTYWNVRTSKLSKCANLLPLPTLYILYNNIYTYNITNIIEIQREEKMEDTIRKV